MITRAYENANGERQEITFPAETWAALTEIDLNRILGFGEPEVPAPVEVVEEVVEETEADDKPAKATKAKKSSKAAAE